MEDMLTAMTQLNTTKRGFWRNRSGSAMIEFALGSPVMIAMGMYGLEFANIAIVNRQISQTTMSMADNISRVGPADGNAGITTVDESDVNDTLSGGKVETGGTINADGSITGGGMNITGNGRIIISSLEVNSTNHQFIHWQRCKGALSSRPDSSAADQWGGSNIASSGSSYGVQGDDKGLTGNAASGMGPSSSPRQIMASRPPPISPARL
jgi:Flp pilus assembly pilin Flp